MPKTLHRLNFRVEVVPDIVQDTHKMTQCNPSVIENKIIQAEEYIISEQIKRWIEKFGICDDIIKEAKKRKDELEKNISNYDRAVSNWLHEVELEKKKNACEGYLKYKYIKEVVDKRRIAKDEWVIINNILRMDFRNLDREVVNKAIIGLAKRNRYRH